MKIAWVGTFEPGFSRNKKLSRLLELIGAEVEVVQVSVWGNERVDQVISGKMGAAVRYLIAIPRLVWGMLIMPRPDLFLVSYPGWFDVPIVWVVAKMRSRPILFDPFISLYDTVVVDRGMFLRRSWVGRIARAFDWLSLRLAHFVVADTGPHLEYFDSISTLRKGHGLILPLGADDAVFQPMPNARVEPRTVVFHGTFVPLQGLTTIVEAAHLLEGEDIQVTIIGDGQDRSTIEGQIAEVGVQNARLVGLLPLAEIPHLISKAAVCLGIFGVSEKSGRVVPNKLYESVAMRRPVITRSSPAIREAFLPSEVLTVPPGDARALADAIKMCLEDTGKAEAFARRGHERYMKDYHETALARRLNEFLEDIYQSVAGW